MSSCVCAGGGQRSPWEHLCAPFPGAAVNSRGATRQSVSICGFPPATPRPRWGPYGEGRCVRTFWENKRPQAPAATPAYFQSLSLQSSCPVGPWGRGAGWPWGRPISSSRGNLPSPGSRLPGRVCEPGLQVPWAWPALTPGLACPIVLEGEAFEWESQMLAAPTICTASEKRDEHRSCASVR